MSVFQSDVPESGADAESVRQVDLERHDSTVHDEQRGEAEGGGPEVEGDQQPGKGHVQPDLLGAANPRDPQPVLHRRHDLGRPGGGHWGTCLNIKA